MNIKDRCYVHIIESPGDEDILKGILEGKCLSELLSLAETPFKYDLVTTKQTLKLAIEKNIINTAIKYNKLPILHFSMHGDEEGIQLTDGTEIDWPELNELIKKVTSLLKVKLMICMSSCSGLSGVKMAMNDQSHTFSALIGNSKDVDWEDAAVGYMAFYHSLFKGNSVEESVENMKIASCNEDFMTFKGEHVKRGWNDLIQNHNKMLGEFLLAKK